MGMAFGVRHSFGRPWNHWPGNDVLPDRHQRFCSSGFLILFDGVAQLVQSFQCKGWKSRLWHIAIAVLYVLAGISIISNPLLASSFFTLVLAFSLIFAGIARALMAFQLRPVSGWYWPLLSGIASVVLGGMIATRWPASSLFVIGLFVALELLFHGWSTIFIALAAKNAPATGSAEPAPSTA